VGPELLRGPTAMTNRQVSLTTDHQGGGVGFSIREDERHVPSDTQGSDYRQLG
jgi:hypothetical protein